MNELFTLAIAPGALWLLLIFLRIPGVTLILSILVGKLFSEELSQNLYDVANKVITIGDIRQVQLFLLFLPVVLSIILTQSKTPKTKALLNAVPLLFASISIILFALPYTDLAPKIGESGQEIVNSYQNYIVSATAGVGLLFAWLPEMKLGRKKHK